MFDRWLMRALFLLAAFVVAACGGCGGGNSSAPPTVNAGAAQTVLAGAEVTLDGSASSDPGGVALSYSWTLTSAPAGSVAALTTPSEAKPGFTADVAGSYVISLTVSNGQLASAPTTVTITALPTDTLTIVTDRAEPLTGTNVQLSLSGPVPGAQVTWYADLSLVGIGTTASWNARVVANGPHQLSASLKISATNTVEIRRIVNVSNPSVSVRVQSVDGDRNPILVTVVATSPFGISSVSPSLDGVPLATLTSPDFCDTSNPVSCRYRFAISAASGNHTLVVTATDSAGSSDQTSVAVPVFNLPGIVVTSPANNLLVYGGLQVAGTSSTDEPGAAISISAKLGDITILQTKGPSFSTSYDISGLPPGAYTLTVTANDGIRDSSVRRTVFVASSSALAYAPVPGISDDLLLWAMDGPQLVYSKYAFSGPGQHLLNVNTSTDVVLADTPNLATGGESFHYWQLTAGQVYASGNEAGSGDCASYSCVYRWGSDGARTNLSAGNPVAVGRAQSKPIVHDGYALWANEGNTFTLYNLGSGAYNLVTPDLSSIYPIATNIYDFAVTGGVVRVFYDRVIFAPSNQTSDVLRWDADTGQSIRLSTAGENSTAPQTDGARVAWLSAPTGDASGKYSLLTQVVGGGVVSTVAAVGVTRFLLGEGVLAWVEDSGTGNTATRAIKALKGSEVVTLSSGLTSDLAGVGGGFAVYRSASGKTYSWNAVTGQSKLLLDFKPSDSLVKGNTMYFVLSTRGVGTVGGGALYKVTLD